jgi:hydrogenase nickel incorporation protein HypB
MESTKPERIQVVTKILQANDRVARENRARFDAAGVRVVNLISSPGAGKTSLLEATLERLRGERRAGVVVGDIATTRDAERIARFEVPVVQIMTEAFGGSCHLEASTIRAALDQIGLEQLELLFVENVGNLVCPAEFELGEHQKVCMLSVTEGEDKPLKYPLAFKVADLVVLSKTDLVPHLRVDMEALRENVRRVSPKARCLELSAQSGTGMQEWLGWLTAKIGARELTE